MNIVFFGNGQRGIACLKTVVEEGHTVSLAVGHPTEKNEFAEEADRLGIQTVKPADINTEEFLTLLQYQDTDVFVLACYGKILKKSILAIPNIMTVNTHGGKLPHYRGSSPMNWSLINGEDSFTLSVIEVDRGVDSGDVLCERTFQIGDNDTIVDLHRIAEEQLPQMVLEVLKDIENSTVTRRKQDTAQARYFPLRAPDDGLTLWDLDTAKQIYNRIRALTTPYPCAFTFYRGRKVLLVSARMHNRYPFHGEPGKIYRIAKKGLLVCASDACLWITEAVFADDGSPLKKAVKKYERLATVRWSKTGEQK